MPFNFLFFMPRYFYDKFHCVSFKTCLPRVLHNSKTTSTGRGNPMYSLSTQVKRGITQSITCLYGKLLRYNIWKLCNRLCRQARFIRRGFIIQNCGLSLYVFVSTNFLLFHSLLVTSYSSLLPRMSKSSFAS